MKKYKKFFNLRVKKFHFLKYTKLFLGWIFFIFLSLGWKVRGLFWECKRDFLILELESSISRNIRNFFWGRCFLLFGPWTKKVRQVARHYCLYDENCKFFRFFFFLTILLKSFKFSSHTRFAWINVYRKRKSKWFSDYV